MYRRFPTVVHPGWLQLMIGESSPALVQGVQYREPWARGLEPQAWQLLERVGRMKGLGAGVRMVGGRGVAAGLVGVVLGFRPRFSSGAGNWISSPMRYLLQRTDMEPCGYSPGEVPYPNKPPNQNRPYRIGLTPVAPPRVRGKAVHYADNH